MKSIALYNLKGGVGKTTTAVNVAHLAAESGLRTLLWDLDPQAATSFYLEVRPQLAGGARTIVKAKNLDEAIRGTAYPRLSVLPADFSIRNLDLDLDEAKKSRKRIQKVLEAVEGAFDLVVLDAPPGLSLLSEGIFSAVDLLVVPLVPTTLSLRAWHQVNAFLAQSGSSTRTLAFFNMVDRRKRMHLETLARYADDPSFLRAEVPYASDVENMGAHKRPVGAFAPRRPAAAALARLWRELEGRLLPRAVAVAAAPAQAAARA